jgi:hypothetical protein
MNYLLQLLIAFSPLLAAAWFLRDELCLNAKGRAERRKHKQWLAESEVHSAELDAQKAVWEKRVADARAFMAEIAQDSIRLKAEIARLKAPPDASH